MHRNPLLSLITTYKAQHPEEMETIQRLTTFIQNNTHCFNRTLTVGHITGSAWLTHPDGSKVLLTHHRKLNKWLQLGGHADGQTDILSVAQREAVEESGLSNIVPLSHHIFDIDIHPIPANSREAAHDHYDIRFALQAIGSDHVRVSEESHDLSWVPITALHEITSEISILRMRRKWLKSISNYQSPS